MSSGGFATGARVADDLPDISDRRCVAGFGGVVRLHCIPRRAGKSGLRLDQIEKAFSSLSENPERGACTKELPAIGLREYREIFFKPDRIIYRVMAENVYVMVIADGRRDMQTLLQRRLLQA